MFEGIYDAPTYSERYDFPEGAQPNLFQDATVVENYMNELKTHSQTNPDDMNVSRLLFSLSPQL